ncbi:hypothetical protein T4B_11113 [Trichinella pseudospiralis]|uniref:Uncharacterized protein n=2 Tax=Trichinella pseudospiralis TaxID=6337 RepID=A0A0V1FM12_TRIPS|nr:hypothetical protein T4D_1751 [Trichinella pseudospiralis]KRZ17468.1 hypothetical protein T4B_11113 [Trichinella pseudospiralis]KRZ35819.1 hypothetical protein T4C_11686 [Trichinella pseudospiralis]
MKNFDRLQIKQMPKKNGTKVFKTIDLKRIACDFASKISQRQNPFFRAKKHRGHVRQGLRGG